jgi:hypothetical protein
MPDAFFSITKESGVYVYPQTPAAFNWLNTAGVRAVKDAAEATYSFDVSAFASKLKEMRAAGLIVEKRK